MKAKYITVEVLVGGSSSEHIERGPHPGSGYDLESLSEVQDLVGS